MNGSNFSFASPLCWFVLLTAVLGPVGCAEESSEDVVMGEADLSAPSPPGPRCREGGVSVGIDDWSFGLLRGCVSDAEEFHVLTYRVSGFPEDCVAKFDTRTETDAASREALDQAASALTKRGLSGEEQDLLQGPVRTALSRAAKATLEERQKHLARAATLLRALLQ